MNTLLNNITNLPIDLCNIIIDYRCYCNEIIDKLYKMNKIKLNGEFMFDPSYVLFINKNKIIIKKVLYDKKRNIYIPLVSTELLISEFVKYLYHGISIEFMYLKPKIEHIPIKFPLTYYEKKLFSILNIKII
jgi:hypothetical protein